MSSEAYISFDQVQNAAFFNDCFKISECLGIRSDEILDFRDKMLFLSYLQQGLLKRNVLNSPMERMGKGCLTELPGFQFIVRMIENSQMKRQEKSLTVLKCSTREYIERYYSSESSRMRVTNIQLAVNDMIANSTSPTKNFTGAIFNPDSEYLERWGKKWQNVLRWS